jgi:VWFA-related protein
VSPRGVNHIGVTMGSLAQPMRGGRSLLWTAVPLIVLVAGVARAQTPPSTPHHLPPVTAEVVRVDVLVTDRGGRPRAGLRGEDFVVLEDGQPRPITSFAAFAVNAPSAPPSNAPAAPEGGRQRTQTPNPNRYVVLVVDDIHIEAGNLARLRKTLERFLDRDLGIEDQVALVTTSGQRSQEFTEDRHSLRQVAAKLAPQERRTASTRVPYITEYQAERIAAGDPEALRLAVEEITSERTAPNAEFEAKAVARAVLNECIQNARATLGTLENVVRGMSNLPGRKIVILFSDGFLTGLSVEGSAAFDIRRITDAGMRAGVILYSLDSKGLVALTPGTSASSRMPIVRQIDGSLGGFNLREELSREGEFAIRNAMGALADDSGGFLVADTNDLGKWLRRTLQDTDSYYLIAYAPAAAEDDGRFRRIEVRLPGLHGVRVRHRKGYFAGGGRASGSTTAAGAPNAADSSASPASDPGDSAMRLALLSPSPLTDIPLRLSADLLSVDATRLQLVVNARVDLRPALFRSIGDRRQAIFTVAAIVLDDSGAVVASLPAERSTLELSDAELARAVETGLSYQQATPVSPGRYRVRVAVRADGQGWVGNASQRVEAPDLADGKLTLSSLFLFKEGSAKGTSAVAAVGADGRSLRSAQVERQFHREESLYVQFFACDGRSDAAGEAALVAVAELWRDGKRLAASGPEAMTADEGGGPPLQLRRIGLRPFEPGDYELRMVVTEEPSRRTASASTTFAIE